MIDSRKNLECKSLDSKKPVKLKMLEGTNLEFKIVISVNI